MKKKLNIIGVQNFIREKRKYIFTPLDLQRYFSVNCESARKFILRNITKDIYAKIKRGLYFDKNFKPSELEIANKLYYPSYVSFEYALMFYGIIPETVYSITSATSKTTRNFIVENINYSFCHIKKEVFTGYIKKNIEGQLVYLAEPEKALADYFYFVDLKKKSLYDRINVNKINYKKLMNFIKLFNRASLKELAQKIYDKSRRNKEIIY
ncbi:hypothetical protein HY750_03410 [Candidatus Kuenenbacteria bacterium]|nr:hypothetical protein [Candidatus Kuenenbacteria bacterium]